MGFDFEQLLGTDNSEEFDTLFYDDIDPYYFDPYEEYDPCNDHDEAEDEPQKTIAVKSVKDYARGSFNGKWVCFNRNFATHKFTENEVRELLNGKTITITYESKNKKKKTTEGHLQLDTSPQGRQYYRFMPSYDDKYK